MAPQPTRPPSPLFEENTERSIAEIPINAGPHSNLFYYDPVPGDMTAVYAAGPDIENPSFFDQFHRIMFDQEGKIYAWDLGLAAKEAPEAVNEIADVADPMWDASESVMLFHNPDSAYLFVRFDQPAPPPDARSGVWLQGQVLGFPKIAAVGSRHGGIVDANLDDAATEVAFITGDGGLYIYGIRAGTLYQATAVNQVGDGRVEEMALCPAGSQVAFRSGSHLFLYFLQSNVIDPLPFANAADDAIYAHAPHWITNQEFWVLLDLPDGRTLFARYNWLTETVRAAFFFNTALGAGFQTTTSR